MDIPSTRVHLVPLLRKYAKGTSLMMDREDKVKGVLYLGLYNSWDDQVAEVEFMRGVWRIRSLRGKLLGEVRETDFRRGKEKVIQWWDRR